jgi:hypothetical protein
MSKLSENRVRKNYTISIQPESKRLLNALKCDPLLRSAVENPFYLNTAQLLFASGNTLSDFGFVATDITGRQQELVKRFVERALNTKTGYIYPSGLAIHWLSFLASRMTQRNMVVFELSDLQYDWWEWSKLQKILEYSIYGFVIGLRTFLLFAILIIFSLGLSKSVIIGMFIFLMFIIFGILLGFGGQQHKIEVIENSKITVKNLAKSKQYLKESIFKSLVVFIFGVTILSILIRIVSGNWYVSSNFIALGICLGIIDIFIETKHTTGHFCKWGDFWMNKS